MKLEKRSHRKHLIAWVQNSFWLLAAVSFTASAGNLKITYLPTHTGCVIETPSGKVYVYDPGNSSEFYDTDTTGGIGMGTYLRKQGITKIDGMVISHPHLDHYDACAQMFQDFNVIELIDTGFNPNGNSNGGYNSEFWNAFQASSATRRTGLRRGDVLNWDPELTVEVRGPKDPFWTFEESLSDPEKFYNQNSLVLLITHGNISHYLTGDITPPAQDYLENNSPLKTMAASILSVPHHGKYYFDSGFAHDFGSDHPLARVGIASEDHTEKGAAADTVPEWTNAGLAVYTGDGNNEVSIHTTGGNEFILETSNPAAAKIFSVASNYSHAPFFTATGANSLDVAYDPASRLTQFSVGAWFRTSDTSASGAERIIVNKGGLGSEAAGQNMNYGIWMMPSGQIQAGFETSLGANVFVTSPATFNNGQWHYATVTYDQAVLRLYIDGSSVATLNTTAVPDSAGTTPVRVGADAASLERFFKGDIDEVRVWDRAISGGEISNHYYGGRVNYDGLLTELDMACQKLYGTNYFELPSIPQLKLTNFTIQTQFRTTAPPPPTQVSMILNRGGFGSDAGAQNQNFGLWIDADGFLCGGFESVGGADYFANSTQTVNDGKWHTAEVTFNGSAVILKLDETEIARTNTTVKPDTTGTQPFRIGANSRTVDRFFTGDVDYIKIINPAIGTVYWNQLKFSEYQIDVLPPAITSVSKINAQFKVTVERSPNVDYELWRAAEAASQTWSKVNNANIVTNANGTITLTDPAASAARSFYRVMATQP